MMGMITFFTVLFLSITGITAEMMADGECDLIQYLNIGENGIIQCSFETFLGLSWYNTDKNRGILFFKDGAKTGEGYERGEYDIFSNGSLLVRNVTLDHDGFFSVTKVIAAVDAITVKYDIQVKTVVKPTSSYPIIDECADGTPSCLISVNSDGYIRCHIDKSRPPVNLTWIKKKHGSDILLPSNYSSSPHDNITFISQTTVPYSVSQLSLLNLFICQVSSIPNDLVSTQESVILLEKGFDYAEAVTPIVENVEVNFDVMLLCAGKTIGGIVWKQLLHGKDSWSTILYTIPPPHQFTEYYLTGFGVESNGSLLLTSIETEHEGLYSCIHQDDSIGEDITLYDVKVHVNPVPAYPVVDGCNHQQYCVLHVTDGDFLNCSIFGIRPKVTLEWKSLQDTGKVSFEDRSHSVKQIEDRFDVILTSRVSFSPSSGNRMTVVCRVIDSDSHLFDLSTTLDLVFENVPVSNKPALASLVIIPIVVIISVIIITLLQRNGAKQRERPRQTLNGKEDGERYPMMQGVNESNEPTSEGEKLFVTQLKTKYELLYNSVLPIPYNKNRILCVDKVYVKGGIEFLTDVTRGTWETLTSYRELLTETCLNSKRQVIEGKPGYGKSTLMLQLVYDWCNNISSSPLGAVDIIIYLRLRQLSGVTSVETAIKRFILPKDTPLSEEDINAILGKFSHILFLLDGFDEYPDQNNPESFVLHILKKELFQDADVILTTRSSCFPKKITPNTGRARLTGFNEKSRDAYITKAVTGENRKATENIKRRLLENPVLGDLCVVPLFFVMFAHVTHENENLRSFKSVTCFFTYMIQCFHSHMKNKMDDENVAHFHVFENDHKILDKIAFDSLNRQNEENVWKRGELTEKLGKEVYDQCVRIGILVEKKIHEIVDETEPLLIHRDKWEVRFYHKIFCEWYAAYHLSDSLRNTDYDNYDESFKYLDPYDLQYLYRFTCGIDENTSRKIIKHFQSTGNQMFAILCMFEQQCNNEVVLEEIHHMVSANSISIKLQDTKLLQISTIQILDLSSKNKISISCVTLDHSFDKVENNEIRLRSGLILPKLLTLEKMHIETEDDRELTEDDVVKIFTYELQSQRLQEISFGRCLLPLLYPLNSLFSHMITRDVVVSWCRYGYRLDFNFRIWRVENIDTVKSLCSTDVHIRKNDSELQQNCTIELLKNASKNKISISCVSLDRCFDKVDENKIKLKSGLTLPILLTQEKIHIQTEKNRELTEEDVNKIFTHGLESQRLQEISFDGCLLPLSISVSGDMIDRHINVSWCKYGYGLNLKSGLWRVENVDTLRKLCSEEIYVKKNQSELKRNCSIELLKNASRHKIPISSVTIRDYSPKMDKSGSNLTLHPGVSLPIMNSLQALRINDNSRLSDEDFAAILYYSSQCESLKGLRFISDNLPTTVPLKSIPAPLISRNVEVVQCASTATKTLNFQTGDWKTEVILQDC